MSFLQGIAGSIVTLIGDNIYPLPDTAIYFNEISTSGRAQIVKDSFSPDYRTISVYVPSKWPTLSNVIFYNSVEYVTGKGQFKFIDKPLITSLDILSGVWRDSVRISGTDFINVTSVKIGESESNFLVLNENTIKATIPSEAKNGFVSVTASGGQSFFLTSSGNPFLFEISEPRITIDGLSPASGRFGQEITASGLSFHKVNEIRVTGLNGEIVIDDFERFDTTGIRFKIPDDTVTSNPIKALKTIDATLGGYYLPQIVEEGISSGNLLINNRKILSISPISGIYGEEISLSGLNLNGSSIFFRAYSTGESPAYYLPPLQSTYIDSTRALVRVPKEIIRDNIYVSGNLLNCTLLTSGSDELGSQSEFQNFLSSGACGDFVNGYELGRYLRQNVTYQTYVYRPTFGPLAISGRTSGITAASFNTYFESGYTGTYLGHGYGKLTPGIHSISGDPSSASVMSGVSIYEITGANTGIYPFASGWVMSGTVVTKHYITSGDIYDVFFLPSSEKFTPLPTITGMPNLIVGDPFSFVGVNCSEIYNLLLMTGENKLKSNVQEVSILSNQDYQFLSSEGKSVDYIEYFRYIGKIGFDLREVNANLPTSAATGNLFVTGITNDTFIGTGKPFLISKYDKENVNYDFNYFSDIKSFAKSLPTLKTFQVFDKVLGETIIDVSGKNNQIAESIFCDNKFNIFITGKYLQDVTGVFLTGLSQDPNSGLFLNLSEHANEYIEGKIRYSNPLFFGNSLTFDGKKDFYERSHSLYLSFPLSNSNNLSLFESTGKNTFFEDYLMYNSGKILLINPFYEPPYE